MAYELRQATAVDIETITTDLEADQRKKVAVLGDQWLTLNRDAHIAIDRTRDSYIFVAPPSRDRPTDPRFYFFHKKNWYEIWVNDLFGNLVHFDDPEPKSASERDELRLCLKEALFVIGRYSIGSPDLFNSIVAEFKNGE